MQIVAVAEKEPSPSLGCLEEEEKRGIFTKFERLLSRTLFFLFGKRPTNGFRRESEKGERMKEEASDSYCHELMDLMGLSFFLPLSKKMMKKGGKKNGVCCRFPTQKMILIE